jgi:predicted RNA-binding Zn ribbon-like protein
VSGEAPGGLELVQAFINSVELPDGEDQLGDAERAAAWLEARGVDAGRLDAGAVRRLVEVRETLRDALESHTGNHVEGDVFVRLQRLLDDAVLVPRLSPAGGSLAPGRPRGADGLIAAVAAAVVEATYRDTWDRLKVCRSDTCRWAFYDRSKNGCGHWCSMETCGSRHKARSYRARKRTVPA